jgi:hypothetical protein
VNPIEIAAVALVLAVWFTLVLVAVWEIRQKTARR